MTPAENPREAERNRVLVRLEKNAIALPIPVDNPAKTVKPKAKSSVSKGTFIFIENLRYLVIGWETEHQLYDITWKFSISPYSNRS